MCEHGPCVLGLSPSCFLSDSVHGTWVSGFQGSLVLGKPSFMDRLPPQSSYQTEIGQTLDLITAPQGSVDLGRYMEKRYKSIIKYKTAFYSFYLPVVAATYMASIDGRRDVPMTR